ncbi:uncharacterized protein LOC116667354 [Camelus ferus]|uniref:Uncharacterized protein LOC116667354 n=1 Tax=Camelus ferus TaxID=419612 RepID=A0A8B8U1G3_CAMFR|nr:uncharacterized protein LOC116667354 [Camelus ferus]
MPSYGGRGRGVWRSWAAVGESPRGRGGWARGGRSRPGQGSRGAGPEAWAPGAFPAGAVRYRRRRRCCWSRCRCWNSCRDLSMFLSARSPQPRHPAPTQPCSRSLKPTPRASRQAPAANRGQGTPLSNSPPHPSSPHPLPPAVPRLSVVRGRSQSERFPGARGLLRARSFLSQLAPAPSSPRLAAAPGSHSAPSRGPQSLLRPACLRRLAPSCVPAQRATPLPPVSRKRATKRPFRSFSFPNPAASCHANG